MPQSLANIVIHVTFSTKDRRPLIAPDIRQRLTEYIGGILRGLDCPAISIGTMDDHLHILFTLSRKQTLAGAIEEIKKSSSKWMKEHDADFYWQRGYGAFSVSQSGVAKAKAYIESQEEHHRRVSFQDEFRAFLARHEVEYDERYVWD